MENIIITMEAIRNLFKLYSMLNSLILQIEKIRKCHVILCGADHVPRSGISSALVSNNHAIK